MITGITGNEKADQTAKSALNSGNITAHITSFISQLFASWQHLWHNLTCNKFHTVQRDRRRLYRTAGRERYDGPRGIAITNMTKHRNSLVASTNGWLCD